MNKTGWTLTLVVILIIIAGGLYLWGRQMPVAQAPSGPVTVDYQCDSGKTLQATYVQGGTPPAAQPGQPPQPTGSVELALSDGRTMTLPQAVSGSGIRYANSDESIVFWSEGNGAFLLEKNQQTYSGCVAVAPNSGDLQNAYASSTAGFSIRYPSGYTVDPNFVYQELGPGKDISGVKFTIPASVAKGTNLGSDSYVSVEEIPNATSTCDASMFLQAQGPGPLNPQTITDNNTTYSVASTTGAGAGNRYEETVYAIPGTNPCTAVRYFIHYSVLENYPPGKVQAFDHQALVSQFDEIRRTLTLI